MTRHLSFVAALGVCFYALTVSGHGQEVKTAREAAVARDGNNSPIMGIPHDKVEELVRGAKLSRERLTTQQPENIALLRKLLELNEGQVLAALDVEARGQSLGIMPRCAQCPRESPLLTALPAIPRQSPVGHLERNQRPSRVRLPAETPDAIDAKGVMVRAIHPEAVARSLYGALLRVTGGSDFKCQTSAAFAAVVAVLKD
jgi:hypothetical protein